ncbi:DUF3291 domain-containing protein [Fretibacter rubidus]|uniref:DUF3291 domain-containing protein n=1 Tax=Fretibacter rubidus TaxID=570162 RepID=UPI00352AEFA7
MQLAQLNIAEGVVAMDDPQMQPFTGRIDAINALADRTDGFIWRLTDDDADIDGALSLRLPGDDTTLVNMSVWDSVEALFSFVYKTAHAKVMTDNRENFVDMPKQHFVLWWVEDGHIPPLTEAKARLDDLRDNGPNPHAFTFAMPFSAEGQPITPSFPKKDCA